MANVIGGRHVKVDTASSSLSGVRNINAIVAVSTGAGSFTLQSDGVDWLTLTFAAAGEKFMLTFATPQVVQTLTLSAVTNTAIYVYFE